MSYFTGFRALPLLGLPLLAALVACTTTNVVHTPGPDPSDPSSGSSTDDGGNGNGSDAGPPVAACQVTGFAGTSIDFGLPSLHGNAGNHPFDSLAGSGSASTSDSFSFATLDIDGDHLLDLVITKRSTDPSIGRDKWSVFKGDGAGFASSATDFALPPMHGNAGNQPFGSLDGSGSASTSDSFSFATLDIDGDHLLDLVITKRSTDPSIGRDKWSVFKGDGSGFSASAADFALPPMHGNAGNHPFDSLAGSGSASTSDSFSFATLDIDGDHLLDLVITKRSTDPAMGRDKWSVFKGDGSGFASAATDFALPPMHGNAGNQPFDSLDGSGSASTSDFFSFATLDIDSDGSLDLVLTKRSTDDAVGRDKWIVFKGDGSGFAPSAADFALPPMHGNAGNHPFEELAGDGSASTTDYFNHATLDIDGDGKLDQVLTKRSTDGSIGRDKWTVFKGDGSGFAADATDFVLPPMHGNAGNQPFDELAGEGSASSTDYFDYSTLDVDGDHQLDVVITKRSTDDAIGRDRWLVFRGTCE